MPEIKSADAAELTRIMGQAAAASGGTTESGKTGDAAADNDGEAAKAAAPAAAKPYMRSILTTAPVSKCRQVITGCASSTGKPV